MSRSNTELAVSLPYSGEAEKALLGGVLLDFSVNLPIIKPHVETRDFYPEAHRIIYGCMLEMEVCGSPIDLVTLKDALRSIDELDKIGGAAYLASLTDGLPTAVNFLYYAKIVHKRAEERRLISSLQQSIQSLTLRDGSSDRALGDLKVKLASLEVEEQETETSHWRTVSCNHYLDWEGVPGVEWLCEPLIPRGSFGFVGGGPKDGKSPLIIDLCIHLAQAQYAEPGSIKFLGKFPVRGEKVLYVAKEDDLRRLNMRWPDINASYGYASAPDLTFLPRKLTTMDLTRPEHIVWIQQQLAQKHYTVLVLDVLSELIPGMDEMKETRQVLYTLKSIQDEFSITIIVLDHIRKPEQKKSGRVAQEPNPFELRGLMAKYGASDFMIMLARTTDSHVLRLHCENKESDEHQDLMIRRTPFGTMDKPKHSIEASYEELGAKSHERSLELRGQIKQQMADQGTQRWLTSGQIAAILNAKDRTVQRHLKLMFEAGEVERRGKASTSQWHLLDQESLPEESDGLFP